MSETLTVEAVLNMPAGDELDALVLERVFGGFAVRSYDCKTGESHLWKLNRLGPSGSVYGDRPSYSTDIRAAWTIVEKLLADGWGGYGWDGFGGGRKWLVGFGDYRVEADTMPLAICRAALVAVLRKEAATLSAGPGSG